MQQFLWKIRGSNSKMLQWNGSRQLQYASNSKENKEKNIFKKKTEKHNSQNNSGPFIIFSYIRVYRTMFIEIAMHWEILDWTYNYLCSVGHFPATSIIRWWIKPENYFASCDPHHGKYPDIYSEILFDISDIYIYCSILSDISDMLSDIVPGILFDIQSDMLSDMIFGILSGAKFRSVEVQKAGSAGSPPWCSAPWPSWQVLLKSRDPLLAGEKVVGG